MGGLCLGSGVRGTEPRKSAVPDSAETVYVATSRLLGGGRGLFSRVALPRGTVFADAAFGTLDDPDKTTNFVVGMSNDAMMPDVLRWITRAPKDSLAEMLEYERLSSLDTNCVLDFTEDPTPVGPGGKPRAPLRVQMRALKDVAAGEELLRTYGAPSWLAIGGASSDAGRVDALAAAYFAAKAHRGYEEYLWAIARFTNQLAVGGAALPLRPNKATFAQRRRKIRDASSAEELAAYVFGGTGPLADLDDEEDAAGK